MAGLFGSPEIQRLAEDDPEEYYKQTPFVRSLWESRLPTWLEQAYKQDVKPAIDAASAPTMEQVLRAPYNLASGAVKGAIDTIDSAQKDPSDPRKMLELALMSTGTGGLLGRAPTGSLGVNVWHGGPNKWAAEPEFPEGRPRLDKIGAGEGNAAYGDGFYAAEAQSVGSGYKKKLSPGDVLTRKDGTIIRPTGADTPDEVFASFASGYGDLKEASASLKEQIQMLDDGSSIYHNMRVDPGSITPQKLRDKYAEALTWFDANKNDLVIDRDHGALYKLDIPDEDVAKYLDWDAPLSEQPEGVRQALDIRKIGELNNMFHSVEQAEKHASNIKNGVAVGKSVFTVNPNITGRDIYRAYAREFGATQADSSAALKRDGIPGLRYFDGMSRNKPLKEIKRDFLDALPEDADMEDVSVLFGKGHFKPDQEAVLKALEADDWLGFDYPSQAISAAFSPSASNWDMSPALVKAIAKAKEGGTRNYVSWDQGVLDRTKMLEKNGMPIIDDFK